MIALIPPLIRSDAEIARDVGAALKRPRFHHALRATVDHGHVTLAGAVASAYEHDSADTAVRVIPGVTAVSNDIVVFDPEEELF